MYTLDNIKGFSWENPPPLVTVKEAREKGYNFYYLGKACNKSGLPAVRRIKKADCVCDHCRSLTQSYRDQNRERLNELARVYRKENSEEICKRRRDQRASNPKIKEAQVTWRLKNPEKIKAYKRKYASVYAEKVSAYGRKYREENKERLQKWSKVYRAQNLPSILNRNALRRSLLKESEPPDLSKKEKSQMAALYKEARNLTETTGLVHHVDHIYPLHACKKQGIFGHHPNNLRVILAQENLEKGGKVCEDLIHHALVRVST